MRFVTTQGGAPATSLEWALFDGLAPDGSLYMPEAIDRLTPEEIARPSVAFAGGNRHPRPPALHRRRDLRGHAGVHRRRRAQFSDSAGRSRAGRARPRALSRADARVQGHRRARDGASDFGAARSRGARHRSSWPRRAIREARSGTPSTGCRTRASSCSIQTAG